MSYKNFMDFISSLKEEDEIEFYIRFYFVVNYTEDLCTIYQNLFLGEKIKFLALLHNLEKLFSSLGSSLENIYLGESGTIGGPPLIIAGEKKEDISKNKSFEISFQVRKNSNKCHVFFYEKMVDNFEESIKFLNELYENLKIPRDFNDAQLPPFTLRARFK